MFFNFNKDSDVLLQKEYGYSVFINKDNRIAKKYPRDAIFNVFREGLAVIKKASLYGYMDKNGDIAIPLEFTEAKNFSDGLEGVKINDYWGFIDKDGQIVITPKWDKINKFNDGIATVYDESKENWVIINKNDEVTRTLGDFQDLSSFNFGLARVKKDGKYGFINTSGEIVIPPIYAGAYNWKENFISVRLSKTMAKLHKNRIEHNRENIDKNIYLLYPLYKDYPPLQNVSQILNKKGEIIGDRDS